MKQRPFLLFSIRSSPTTGELIAYNEHGSPIAVSHINEPFWHVAFDALQANPVTVSRLRKRRWPRGKVTHLVARLLVEGEFIVLQGAHRSAISKAPVPRTQGEWAPVVQRMMEQATRRETA